MTHSAEASAASLAGRERNRCRGAFGTGGGHLKGREVAAVLVFLTAVIDVAELQFSIPGWSIGDEAETGW